MRAEKGITQAEAGSAIGVAEVTYQKWESGNSPPSRKNMAKLCHFYGITEAYLCTGQDAAGGYHVIKNDAPSVRDPAPQPIGFGEAVELLKKIYDSGDAPRINAISHNLVQFAADADLRAKIDQEGRNDIEAKMDRRFADFEKIMEKKCKEIMDAVVGKASRSPRKVANDGGT